MSTPKNKIFFSIVDIMSKWTLGPYIARLIEDKGGRQGGWPRSRVAKAAGISPSYLKWIIDGTKADKLNPPEISLDVIIRLSKALDVSIISLVAAYQGQDPDKIKNSETQRNYKSLIMELLQKLPSEDVIELALLKAGDSNENREEMKKEIAKRQKGSV